jgi:hypothetical protein
MSHSASSDELEGPWRKLVEQLTELGRDFNNARTASEKRQKALGTLELVYVYLEQDPTVPLEAKAVFAALYADIGNMEEGQQLEFLNPPPVQSGKGKPIQIETIHAIGAAAVDHLVSAKWSKADAARIVVSEMNRLKLPLPAPKSTSERSDADRLLDYRTRLRSKPKPHIRKSFDEALRKARRHRSPLDGVRAILKIAASLLGQKVQ